MVEVEYLAFLRLFPVFQPFERLDGDDKATERPLLLIHGWLQSWLLVVDAQIWRHQVMPWQHLNLEPPNGDIDSFGASNRCASPQPVPASKQAGDVGRAQHGEVGGARLSGRASATKGRVGGLITVPRRMRQPCWHVLVSDAMPVRWNLARHGSRRCGQRPKVSGFLVQQPR